VETHNQVVTPRGERVGERDRERCMCVCVCVCVCVCARGSGRTSLPLSRLASTPTGWSPRDKVREDERWTARGRSDSNNRKLGGAFNADAPGDQHTPRQDRNI